MRRNGHILLAPRPAGPHVVRRRFQGILGKRRTMEKLRARHGERFAPALMLVDLAREGCTFHAPRD